MTVWTEFGKLRVTAFSGLLVALVRGCGGILFTWYLVNLGWSRNNFITRIGRSGKLTGRVANLHQN